MCNDFLKDAECQHKITKKEITSAILNYTRQIQNDYAVSEMLGQEFMSGRQNT